MSENNDKIKKQLQDKFEELLQGPFENICMSAINDFVKTQVIFSERAGLSAKIIRYPIGKCCEWCEQLAGTYNAADAPPEIYARHDNCTCVVLYKSEKTGKYTDVWSKKEFESEREARIAREHELEKNTSSRVKIQQEQELEFKKTDRFKNLRKMKPKLTDKKVDNFFLQDGAKHSKEFFNAGYSINNRDQFIQDIIKNYDPSKAVDIRVNNDGSFTFSTFENIGVTKKKRFRFVWRQETENSAPRIITGYRED